jgi:hypothetical protein
MGGINDNQIKFAVETARINEINVLAAHFKNLDLRHKDNSKIGKNESTSGRDLSDKNEIHKITRKNTSDNINLTRNSGNKSVSSKQHNDSYAAPDESFSSRRCFLCKKRGHIKRACPLLTTQRQKSKTPQNKQPAIEYQNVNLINIADPNSKFFKDITVNNVKQKSYIDFGSQCSIITTEAATQLNLKIEPLPHKVVLRTIGTETVEIRARALAIITLDNITRDIELLITDRCVFDVHILIGQNFTELPDVCYAKSDNILTFFEEKIVNSLTVDFNSYNINVGISDEIVIGNLLQLLNEYSVCLAEELQDIGIIPDTYMKIELTSYNPIALRPRRYPEPERNEIRKIVNTLLKHGIIRESRSPYAFSIYPCTRLLRRCTYPGAYNRNMFRNSSKRLSNF